MRVLVCGGRGYANDRALHGMLDSIPGITVIIHGGASGADSIAGVWAAKNNKSVEVYRARWSTLGPAAGPMRNQRMIDEGKPDMVVAAPGGAGTADMLRRARAAGPAAMPHVRRRSCSNHRDGQAGVADCAGDRY